MTDGIIKGTGNSRFLKGPANAAALYPDFPSFRDAWAAGTLPIDLNGINPAGWDVVGDKIGKETLLTDALCTALGLPTTATPTQAMDKLRQLVNTAQSGVNNGVKLAAGKYVGNGDSSTYPSPNPSQTIVLPFTPKAVFVAKKQAIIYGSSVNIGLATTGSAACYPYENSNSILEIRANGFLVSIQRNSSNNGYDGLNGASITYNYLAVG